MFALLIGMTSCKKETTEPVNFCNCGLILSDNVEDFSIIIKNDCSSEVKTFYLTQSEWMVAHPGQKYCVIHAKNW